MRAMRTLTFLKSAEGCQGRGDNRFSSEGVGADDDDEFYLTFERLYTCR